MFKERNSKTKSCLKLETDGYEKEDKMYKDRNRTKKRCIKIETARLNMFKYRNDMIKRSIQKDRKSKIKRCVKKKKK